MINTKYIDDQNADNYLVIKNYTLKELENEVNLKNIDFKSLFEKINDNFDFINTENTSLKRAILSGEYNIWMNSSGSTTKEYKDISSLNPSTTTLHNSSVVNTTIGINNEKTKTENQNKLHGNINDKDFSLKSDGDIEKNNIKLLKDQTRKRNIITDNVHAHLNTHNNNRSGNNNDISNDNGIKLATKIAKLNSEKINPEKFAPNKNSPLLKRFKDDSYKNKNIKSFRKLED